jgi:hypothetical protein
MFPSDVTGADVSSDVDISVEEDALPAIEVMTPERCLASLCFTPDRFNNVGLLVFDECHLLAPSAGSFRRSLDGMLCIMAFHRNLPNADFLFLSAMLENGEEFAKWIEWMSGRKCLHISLLWKPSRQARGVVVYDSEDLHLAKGAALRAQSSDDQKKGRKAASIRRKALAKLAVHPYAIWGLRHNWLDRARNKASFSRQLLLSKPVPLAGNLRGGQIHLTPNVNVVAAQIAADASNAGLKTIVFVNNKSHSISTARNVSERLAGSAELSSAEDDRWLALDIELGGLKHSVLDRSALAVPHNASMLKIERDLAERSYRRKDGAQVIVATPTLAQGLNLPAQLAILAGDKRTDPEDGGRDELEAHELLNAAARAGRAGHLANGVVLLVPDPVLATKDKGGLTGDVVSKLQAILPEDDRCVSISDPVEVILDRLTLGDLDDQDVRYAVNRLMTFRANEGGEASSLFNVRRSFAAFKSIASNNSLIFEQRVDLLDEAVEQFVHVTVPSEVVPLAAKTGLPLALLGGLRSRLKGQLEQNVPASIDAWIAWIFCWIKEEEACARELLREIIGRLNASTGRPKHSDYSPETLDRIELGVRGWLQGHTVRDIEVTLGGNPDSILKSEIVCPRARELIGTVVPRGIAYVVTLVVMTLGTIEGAALEGSAGDVVKSLAFAVRKGLDSPQKVRFALKNQAILSRVQLHNAFARVVSEADGFWAGD